MVSGLTRERSSVFARAAVIALAASILATGLLSSKVEASPFGRPKAVPNWMMEQERSDHSYTRKEAVAIARRFDVITAAMGSFRDHVAAMKAANPRLKILVYVMGMYAWSFEPPGTFPADWYSRDALGQLITTKGEWAGNYLMNPSKGGWIRNRLATCKSFLRTSRYDGCYIDVLGPASLDPKYVTGTAVDPSTGESWTTRAWLRATGAMAARIRDEIRRPVVGNGLQDGIQYFDPTAPSQLMSRGIEGGVAEGWMRAAGNSVAAYPSVQAWKRNVNMLRHAGRQGKSVFVITKVWAQATAEERDRWHEFALASFLLGNSGTSFFDFSGSRQYDPTRGHRWWKVRLGDARGRYEPRGEIYVRNFTQGKVFVNPTGQSYLVRLRRTWRTLEGDLVRRVTLRPHTGRILREV